MTKHILPLTLALFACDNGGTDTDTSDSETGGNGSYTVECSDTFCKVSGTINEDFTFTADTEWLLSGGVFVGDDNGADAVLTIEPGTLIYGETSSRSFLAIQRGSQIDAQGTAELPIVFSSAADEGSRARGDWGGIIVNGHAPINNCNSDGGDCEAEGEGSTGYYGGDQPNDDSGILKYVRVEFAGELISPENELNGIAFQGVGSATEIDYVQVHMNADDGIEFFGGTANAKHVVLTGIGDDSLDWTDGWSGNVQFVVAQQYSDAGDQGIEADNNGDNNDYLPRSFPTLANITILGAPTSSSYSDHGVLLREGTAANIHGAVVAGFRVSCAALDQQATLDVAHDGSDWTGDLAFMDSHINCTTLYADADVTPLPFTTQSWYEAVQWNNAFGTDPMLEDPYNERSPNFLPASGSPLLNKGVDLSDSFFETTTYIGAMGSDDWTAGWTTSAAN